MDTQDANIHIHKVNPKEVRVEVVANASGVRNAQGKWRGGQYCSAVDCHNCTYRDGPRGVKFFRYPTNPTMKERWIKQVNRKKPNGSPWSPGPNARLCSEHFVLNSKHLLHSLTLRESFLCLFRWCGPLLQFVCLSHWPLRVYKFEKCTAMLAFTC